MADQVPPGTRGKHLKRLKSFTPPSQPNVQFPASNQFQFEFGDNFRKDDMMMPKNSKQKPRKLDANVVMNTIDQVYQPPSGTVTDYIKKHDPQNTSGAVKPHLDVLDKLLKTGEQALASISGMLGAGLMQQVQQSINQQRPKCPQGYRFDNIQQKCVLECPKGTIWDENQQKCIIDTGNYNPDIDPSTGGPSIFLISV